MRTRLIRALPLSLLGLCGAVLAAHPSARSGWPVPVEGQQAPAPVFRSRVDAIEIEMRVVDARGRPVTDLQQDEIEITEDGRRQPIIGFTHVSISAVAPAKATPVQAASMALDVASNREAASSRIFVLLLDDLHVEARNTTMVRQVARQFIERHLRAGDVASVVHTSGRADASQDFTSDRALLLRAIDRFIGQKLRPATVERMDQYNLLYRGRGSPQFEDLRDRQDTERAYNARSALATMETICSVLARVSGRRKAMLLFSEGIDYDLSGLRTRGHIPGSGIEAPAALMATTPTGAGETAAAGRVEVHGHAKDVLLNMQSAIGAAGRANVAVYPVDVHRGEVSDNVADLGAPAMDPKLGLTPASVTGEMRDAQETLWILGENTGGFATLASSNYDEVFARVVEESSDYYLVAYSPWNIVPDGKFRDISVKVKRPGVKVSARKGYYGPRGPAKRLSQLVAPGISEETSELAMAPLPASGLSLELNTLALRGTKKHDVIVAVHLDGRDLLTDPAAPSVDNTIELAMMALDGGGRILAATGQAFDVRLNEEATRIMVQAGYRSISRLQVPPGRYQIRAAVRERRNGRQGSVFGYVEVPDFGRRIGMSGVLLTSPRAGLIPTSIDNETHKRLPVMPAVRRTFPSGDRLSAAFEVYNAAKRGDLALTTSLVDGSQKEIYRTVTRVDSGRVKHLDGTYLHEVEIPLANISGQVMLVIEARKNGASEPELSRRVALTVDPSSAAILVRPFQPGGTNQ
jgi:VWFA-related protein